jgi:hypothetical protein
MATLGGNERYGMGKVGRLELKKPARVFRHLALVLMLVISVSGAMPIFALATVTETTVEGQPDSKGEAEGETTEDETSGQDGGGGETPPDGGGGETQCICLLSAELICNSTGKST